MALGNAFVIRVVDIYGQPIAEPADLTVSRKDGGVVVRQPAADFRLPLRIENLNQGPGALFCVTIDAPWYQPVSAFVNVPAGGVEVTFPLPFRPSAVRDARFAAYNTLPLEAQALLDAAAYLGLDRARKAGLLNIVAKAEKTVLSSGRSVLSYLKPITRFEQDRIFAEVDPELVEAAGRAASEGLLRRVSSAQHPPPEDYTNGPSYKTKDRFGNLQVTLFQCPGKPLIADIDIDNAAGLKHIFQVVKNSIHGSTHPYDIQAVLIATQKIDTRYTLIAG